MQLISTIETTEHLGCGPNGRTQLKITRTCCGVTTVHYGELLDSDEDWETMQRFNEDMEEVRRDFIYKNAMSERSAQETFVF